MDLYDVRNKIRELLEQDHFNSEGSGMSLVEPEADLDMTYLGRRYGITIRDRGELQKRRQSVVTPDPEDSIT